MHRSRSIAALLAVAALTAGTVSACSSSTSSSASSSASSSDVSISGSPVSTKDDITAQCKSIVDQKLTQEAAAAMAESSGYTSRVIKIDGQGQAVTTDLRDDRMNFDVEKDIVVACTVG